MYTDVCMSTWHGVAAIELYNGPTGLSDDFNLNIFQALQTVDRRIAQLLQGTNRTVNRILSFVYFVNSPWNQVLWGIGLGGRV